MSLAEGLLDTASSLLRRNSNKPSEADLRRAISTAYYAHFHKLIESATARLTAAVASQAALARCFEHGKMKSVCQGLLKQPLPPVLAPFFSGPVPDELKRVARTFVDLQQKRHDADYDRGAVIQKQDARDSVAQCEAAVADWVAVQTDPAAAVFLLLLLLGEPRGR